MEYVVLRNEETGEIEKIGCFLENDLAEQFCDNGWESDGSLYSLMFDGLLENISEAEANKMISQSSKKKKMLPEF